jgi:hypothetical protein
VTRSKITSGKRLLQGVDGRLPAGRRFADLCRAYETQCGGNLTVVGKMLCKQAASLSIRCEQLQADVVIGKPVAIDDLVRATSEIRRILAAVTNKPGRNQAAMPSLADYVLAKYGAEPPEAEPL